MILGRISSNNCVFNGLNWTTTFKNLKRRIYIKSWMANVTRKKTTQIKHYIYLSTI